MRCKLIVTCAFLSVASIHVIAALQETETEKKEKRVRSSSFVGVAQLHMRNQQPRGLSHNNLCFPRRVPLCNQQQPKWRPCANWPISVSDQELKICNVLASKLFPTTISAIVVGYAFSEDSAEGITDGTMNYYYDDSWGSVTDFAQMMCKGRLMMISGSSKGRIHFWDPSNGKIHAMVKVHARRIDALAFSKKHNILISGAVDYNALWHVNADTLQISLAKKIGEMPHAGASCITLAPDEMSFALGNNAEMTRVWSLPDGIVCSVVRKQNCPGASAVAWNHDGTLLLSADNRCTTQDTIDMYNMRTKSVLTKFYRRLSGGSMSCSPIKNQAVVETGYGKLSIIDIPSGDIARSMEAIKLKGSHNKVRWSPSGRYLASMSIGEGPENMLVNIWHGPTGVLIAQFPGVEPYGMLHFISDKILVASARKPGRVVIFTTADDQG